MAASKCFWIMGGALFLAGCAGIGPKPALRVDAGCRVEANPAARQAAPPPSGFGFGFGVFSTSRSHPMSSSNCDGPCPDSRPRSSFPIFVGTGLDTLPRPESTPDAVPDLRRDGPVLPGDFSMACLPAWGIVRGGWPLVVDYALAQAAQPAIEIHFTEGGAAHVIPLDGRPGRHLLRFELPMNLGAEARAALVLLHARPEDGIQVYGLGAGPKAVGSVAIDQVEFTPAAIRRRAGEVASYRFFARSDFNRLSVDVLQVKPSPGALGLSPVRRFDFEGGVNRGTWFGRAQPRTWDGADRNAQTSPGPHLLQVRAWASASDEGDWVTAWSGQAVRVSD